MGITEFSFDDHNCTPILPELSARVLRFSWMAKPSFTWSRRRARRRSIVSPGVTEKLTGPAEAAVKLPFAFRQGWPGNAYDFSKALSTVATVVYSRPMVTPASTLLSQK